MLKGARLLHNQLLYSILKAPISFFNQTPRGRIINRFSKDQGNIDEILPQSFDSFIRILIKLIVTFTLISFILPSYLIILIPICFLYYYLCSYYLQTTRELKRWQSVLNSPIFSLFSETVDGVSTIRAFHAQQYFTKYTHNLINRDHTAYFVYICANRWLGTRLEIVGSLLVFFACLFGVLARKNISTGLIGLAISYSMSITQALNWIVRQASGIENNIVSVERIMEYIEIKSEQSRFTSSNLSKFNHSFKGEISFVNVNMRYRSDLGLVLKNIDFIINPGEKIGIVGRTGSGKSSLFIVLMRLIQIEKGRILIDDFNLSNIELHELRKQIAIIPQDPIAFKGTIRFNLDPANQFSDDAIFNALKQSQLGPTLKKKIKEFDINNEEKIPNYLNLKIFEEGNNLSIGQRQLMCLARALLKRSKILLLDEATSAIDIYTDDLVQKSLRNNFFNCTLMTISHRTNTIVDYDKIMVMGDGNLIEFDTPNNLLTNSKSLFYNLYHGERKK